MADWKKFLDELAAIIVSIGSLFAAIYFTWKNWKKLLTHVLNPFWKKVLKPFLKGVILALTLLIPIGLIIGIIFYEIALFYWEKQSLDFIILNQTVFSELVIFPTVLVSLYAYVWSGWIFPKLRIRLFGKKLTAHQPAENH